MTYVEMTTLSSLVRPMLARAARLNLPSNDDGGSIPLTRSIT